jgi:hypothetical protein
MAFPDDAPTNTEVRTQLSNMGTRFVTDAEIDQQITLATSHIGEIIKDDATDVQENIAILYYSAVLSYDIGMGRMTGMTLGREPAELTEHANRLEARFEQYMIPLIKIVIEEDNEPIVMGLGPKATQGHFNEFTEGPVSS